MTQGLIGSSPTAVPDACGLPGFLLPWQGLEGSLGVSETDRIGVGDPWLRDYKGELVEQL